jgi:hypothetical protein
MGVGGMKRRKPKDWINRLRTNCKDRMHSRLIDKHGFEEYIRQGMIAWEPLAVMLDLGVLKMECGVVYPAVVQSDFHPIEDMRRQIHNEIHNDIFGFGGGRAWLNLWN